MATPDNMTAAQHTAAAHQADQEAQDSFDRCDTDGFLSQWASGMTGRLHRAKAEIAEQGGKAEFPALFDLAGNLVAAKLVETRYGMSWGILPDDSPDGSFVSWLAHLVPAVTRLPGPTMPAKVTTSALSWPQPTPGQPVAAQECQDV